MFSKTAHALYFLSEADLTSEDVMLFVGVGDA